MGQSLKIESANGQILCLAQTSCLVLACLTRGHSAAGDPFLADQGVSSATNFLTGVIIARACSKEELGLYMLGFSLVLFVTDLQTSLISTPYMVYAPRLKDVLTPCTREAP